METLLAPIEKPKGLGMKLAYYFTKKAFGKVIAPLKVHSSRLPMAFGMFYGKVAKLDKKLKLKHETVLLIRQQVAGINICEFCMDTSRWAAKMSQVNMAKFDALPHYKTSALFTDAERAALDYVSELTQNKRADELLFKRMALFYSEREICEIMYIVASEHLYNMTNIGLNIHSDMLCDISKKN